MRHVVVRGRWLLVTVGGLALGVSSAVAYVCHPDPPGTLSLRLRAPIVSYQLAGQQARVVFGTAGSCRQASWNLAAHVAVRRRSSGCRVALGPSVNSMRLPRGVTVPGGYSAAAAVRADGQLVILARAEDPGRGPDLLEVRNARNGARRHVWPLPVHMATLDVAGGIAVLSAGLRREVYAIRLSDGQAALIGLDRAVDRPRVSRAGVLYVDDLYKRNEGAAHQTLKFLPIAAVNAAFGRVGRAVTTPGPISALAMDGPRVALAVRDATGACDSVDFWNIPWAYSSRLTDPHSKTCPAGHEKGGITSLALAGVRAEWITTYGGTSRLLTATIVACRQRVLAVAAAGSLGHVVGHEGLLAFSSEHATNVVAGAVARPLSPATRALAIDAGRVATLAAGGTIELREPVSAAAQYPSRTPALTLAGRTSTREIALQGNELATLAGTHLEVFDARTGTRTHIWNAPRGAKGLDVQYGIATFTDGRRVAAVRLSTGRTVTLVRAPGRVAAQIEAPGLAYAYSRGGTGYVRFLPLAAIWARLGIGG
jgi:hypothetical protein